MKIKAVYDAGDQWADQYTVVFDEGHINEEGKIEYDALALGKCPDHPLGFSQWVSAVLGPHLGKGIMFSELPENVQRHVRQRLAD